MFHEEGWRKWLENHLAVRRYMASVQFPTALSNSTVIAYHIWANWFNSYFQGSLLVATDNVDIPDSNILLSKTMRHTDTTKFERRLSKHSPKWRATNNYEITYNLSSQERKEIKIRSLTNNYRGYFYSETVSMSSIFYRHEYI